MEVEDQPQQATVEEGKVHKKEAKNKHGKVPLRPPSPPLTRARAAIGDTFSIGMSTPSHSIAFISSESPCNSSTHSHAKAFAYTSDASLGSI